MIAYIMGHAMMDNIVCIARKTPEVGDQADLLMSGFG